MPKLYAVTINDAKSNANEVDFFKRLDHYILELPDDIALAVPNKATEDIKIAAQEAQNGNYDALMRATGYDENESLED